MTDNEFILFDRIEKIKSINNEYDLLHNSYISFSGGKDSTILHYLIDLALPNNNIPRLFLNTGIEYSDIRKFVKNLSLNDSRIVILNSGVNIKNMLQVEGYPFKSKEHSLKLSQFQKGLLSPSVIKYKSCVNSFCCPKKLLYQFEEGFDIKISDRCCFRLKKEVAHKWQKENNKSITLTGMRNSEGGQRANIGCIVTDKDNKLLKFHPLIVVSDEWEEWFINEYSVKLCCLYYAPYNFKRTGCKGCPFSLDIEKQLKVMKDLLPNEFKQCCTLWAPIYKEYSRIRYRIKDSELFKNIF